MKAPTEPSSQARRPSRTGTEDEHLLEVQDLRVEFPASDRGHRGDQVVRAVQGVSFHLDRGETVAIVGESGSGKTVSAQAVMGLLPPPPAASTTGSVRLAGRDLLKLRPAERRSLCGSEIAMVFQDALVALNPVLTVGQQVAEMFRVHRGASRRAAREAALELFGKVGIPAPRERYRHYPHQFSGGMRQRLMIAMAVALQPAVLIADEPTTALDVTVQAQILELLAQLQAETQMGVVLITHDLAIATDVADRVVVMYGGRVVETGPVRQVMRSPAHPYTEALMRSVPRHDAPDEPLAAIPGAPPDPGAVPSGCAFHPRCGYAEPVCASEQPLLRQVGVERWSACGLHEQIFGGLKTGHGGEG